MKDKQINGYNLLNSNKYSTYMAESQTIQNQTIHYQEFMSDFLKMFFNCDFKNPFEFQSKPDRELLIVISSNKGKYTNLENILFQNILENYSDHKDTVDVYCIGKSSLSFFVDNGFNIVAYSQFIGDSDESMLSDLHKYIDVSVDDYGKMVVMFSGVKSMITKSPISIDLLSLNQKNIINILKDLSIKFDNSLIVRNPIKNILGIQKEKFGLELLLQLSQHVVYGAILQYKTAELAMDAVNIKTATNHLKGVLDWLNISEIYQWLLTQEVKKIMIERM